MPLSLPFRDSLPETSLSPCLAIPNDPRRVSAYLQLFLRDVFSIISPNSMDQPLTLGQPLSLIWENRSPEYKLYDEEEIRPLS